MYLGQYKLGQELILALQTRKIDGTPFLPDQAPACDVYQTHRVVTKQLPIKDRFAITAFFEYPLFLGGEFSVGRGSVVFRWAIGGTTFEKVGNFEILPGGNIDGQIIATAWFPQPHANFVVHATTAGLIIKGRNPRL